MTSTALTTIPTSADPATWSPEQAAILEFSGLIYAESGQRKYAPRPIVAAFVAAVARTGLDPIAKQIYAMNIGGKWSIVTGIDGFRKIAQESGEYRGQTPVQWTGDGVTWVDAWLTKDAPKAARVGVYRAGYAEPLMQVVTFAEFGKTSGQWRTMPAHMLAIRAESHALRRAFPAQMSGIYTAEDMEQGTHHDDAISVEPTEDWHSQITAATSRAELIAIRTRAQALGEYPDALRIIAAARDGQISRGELPEIVVDAETGEIA